MSRSRFRGSWHHGLKGYFVDVRALEFFLTALPWMLAIDAIIRGWEYMRIGGFLLQDLPTRLVPINGESLVQYEFFGFSMMFAGILLFIGMALARFVVIITSCIIGASAYVLLAGSFAVEAFTTESTIGLRTSFTLLILCSLWVFKGFFAATKKSIHEIQEEAEEQVREFTEGVDNG